MVASDPCIECDGGARDAGIVRLADCSHGRCNRTRSTQIQLRLDRLRAGDESARDELLNIACERLGRLARKMLRGYPGVRRWEQTDDVLQNAALRLCRALDEVRARVGAQLHQPGRRADPPRADRPGAALRRAGGPGASSRQPGRTGWLGDPPGPPDPGTDTDDPARLAAWTEFHDQVEALPDEEREVFDLLWYQGLSQAEAAALLGVTERVVRYRWRSARLKLHEMLGGRLPE